MDNSKRHQVGDLHYTTEKGTRYSLFHLILFCTFLICLTILGNDLTTHHQHYFIKGFRNLLYSPGYLQNNRNMTFDSVITIPDFWDYLEFFVFPMLHGIVYDETVDRPIPWINDKPTLIGRMFLNESLLLGPPRLRQVRVKAKSCHLHPSLYRYFNICYAPYSPDAEFREPVYKGTKYYTMEDLESKPIQGRINIYPSGGYVKLLSYKKDVNLGLIRYFRKIKWLDRASRIVLFEINMINLNLDLTLATKLTFEIMPTGLLNPIYESQSFYMNPMIGSSPVLITVSAVVIYLLNVYYTYVEIKSFYRNGFKYYFTRLSAFLFVPSIFFCYVSFILHIYIIYYSDKINNAINTDILTFIPLGNFTTAYSAHQISMAILVFLSWITLLTFMDFNPVLRTLSLAIKMALTDLGAFVIMFFIAFIAYANLGMLLFGGENSNFKDFSTSLLTMVRLLASDFDYFELDNESPILGPIFFLTYVLLIFFVLMNVFLAAIVLSYRTATATVAYKPSFLLYYIRKQLYRISCGCCKPPKYPEWAKQHALHKPLDENKLRELLLIKEYMEIESDLKILLLRLNLIEKIFFRLSNNMGDIIRNKEKQNKKKEKKKSKK